MVVSGAAALTFFRVTILLKRRVTPRELLLGLLWRILLQWRGVGELRSCFSSGSGLSPRPGKYSPLKEVFRLVLKVAQVTVMCPLIKRKTGLPLCSSALVPGDGWEVKVDGNTRPSSGRQDCYPPHLSMALSYLCVTATFPALSVLRSALQGSRV